MPAAASAKTQAAKAAPADAQSGPAAPQGSQWEALTNLSVGRTTTGKDGDRSADIVRKGETVFLTDEQAAGFLDRRRHRVPVIRPAGQQNEPAPQIRARDLFGSQPPAAAFENTRPDPAGASQIRVIEVADAELAGGGAKDPSDPLNAPEANDPAVESPDPDAPKA